MSKQINNVLSFDTVLKSQFKAVPAQTVKEAQKRIESALKDARKTYESKVLISRKAAAALVLNA